MTTCLHQHLKTIIRLPNIILFLRICNR
uniref:Uncharacterized protein n=1 Tax=Anguilla anguilla TaxID=7936 RepID=A0A0E9SB19_ANGAN